MKSFSKRIISIKTRSTQVDTLQNQMSCLDPCVPASWKKEDSFWNHPAGPKTVFFWAPAFKWGLVLAGLKDVITRHSSHISIFQTIALAITGLIWCRFSLVIIPKNWSLFSVNLFVAITQLIQLGRAFHFYYAKDVMFQKNSYVVATGDDFNSTQWNTTMMNNDEDYNF